MIVSNETRTRHQTVDLTCFAGLQRNRTEPCLIARINFLYHLARSPGVRTGRRCCLKDLFQLCATLCEGTNRTREYGFRFNPLEDTLENFLEFRGFLRK